MFALAIDPNEPSVLYVTGPEGTYKTIRVVSHTGMAVHTARDGSVKFFSSCCLSASVILELTLQTFLQTGNRALQESSG